MKKPDFDGPVAKAWRLNVRKTDLPDHAASVGDYLIESTWEAYHPIWNRWVLVLVHLREVPGLEPAKIQDIGSTHELMIAAIDPELPPVDPDSPPKRMCLLKPVEHVIQFEVPSDVAALSLIEKALQQVCDGLSPDSDFRSYWTNLIKNSAAHYRGEHGDKPTDVT